jgi:hypothetical protein
MATISCKLLPNAVQIAPIFVIFLQFRPAGCSHLCQKTPVLTVVFQLARIVRYLKPQGIPLLAASTTALANSQFFDRETMDRRTGQESTIWPPELHSHAAAVNQ